MGLSISKSRIAKPMFCTCTSWCTSIRYRQNEWCYRHSKQGLTLRVVRYEAARTMPPRKWHATRGSRTPLRNAACNAVPHEKERHGATCHCTVPARQRATSFLLFFSFFILFFGISKALHPPKDITYRKFTY